MLHFSSKNTSSIRPVTVSPFPIPSSQLCTHTQVYIRLLFTLPLGVPAALAEKIFWIGKERWTVNNNALARKFLVLTHVKEEEEVEMRMRTEDW